MPDDLEAIRRKAAKIVKSAEKQRYEFGDIELGAFNRVGNAETASSIPDVVLQVLERAAVKLKVPVSFRY